MARPLGPLKEKGKAKRVRGKYLDCNFRKSMQAQWVVLKLMPLVKELSTPETDPP
jgi:hypothetical protein